MNFIEEYQISNESVDELIDYWNSNKANAEEEKHAWQAEEGYNAGVQTVKTGVNLVPKSPKMSVVPIMSGAKIGGSQRPRLTVYRALIFLSAICSRSGSHARRSVAWEPPLRSSATMKWPKRRLSPSTVKKEHNRV